MIITFTPAEGEKRTYTVRANTLMWVEKETIEEKVGNGQDFDSMFSLMGLGGPSKPKRALLWVLERRTHPDLSWATFGDFPADAIKINLEVDELDKAMEAVRKAPGLTDDEIAAAIRQLEDAKQEVPEVPKEAPALSDESAI